MIRRVLMVVSLFVVAFLPGSVLAQTPTASPTPEPKHDICKPVPEPAAEWISEGLEGENVELGVMWAVKSDDFENVWFVAADLEGPELDDEDGEIALWSTNAIEKDGTAEEGGGLVLSVNGFASEFSDWFDADEYDVSDEDHGAKEAVECVEASLEDAAK